MQQKTRIIDDDGEDEEEEEDNSHYIQSSEPIVSLNQICRHSE